MISFTDSIEGFDLKLSSSWKNSRSTVSTFLSPPISIGSSSISSCLCRLCLERAAQITAFYDRVDYLAALSNHTTTHSSACFDLPRRTVSLHARVFVRLFVCSSRNVPISCASLWSLIRSKIGIVFRRMSRITRSGKRFNRPWSEEEESDNEPTASSSMNE